MIKRAYKFISLLLLLMKVNYYEMNKEGRQKFGGHMGNVSGARISPRFSPSIPAYIPSTHCNKGLNSKLEANNNNGRGELFGRGEELAQAQRRSLCLCGSFSR